MTDVPTGDRFEYLVRMAKRGQGDTDFLAYALAKDRERLGLTEAEQRMDLGVTPENWVHLQLCRAPRPAFRAADLDAVCTRLGAERGKLERIVRSE